MGSNCTSLFSRKKTKNQKPIEYSPRTAREMYNARRTGKLIYPPLSSIPKEEPKRSVKPDGGLLYESVHMDSELDQNRSNYQDERNQIRPHFVNYHNQYDDGTFAVMARYPTRESDVFHL